MVSNFFLGTQRRSSGSQRTPRPQGKFRPTLETLGERCLPSVNPLAAAPAIEVAPVSSLGCACESSQEHDFQLKGAGQILGNPFADTGAPFGASGQATYLGAWTNTGIIFVAPDGSAHGDVVFKAANGDRLAMSFTGQIAPDGYATGTFIIDPGPSTGRFDQASGTLHMELDQNFATGAFQFTLDGPVHFCASDRPDGAHAGASAAKAASSSNEALFQASATRVGLERQGNIFTSYIEGSGTAIGPFDGIAVITPRGHHATGPVTITAANGDSLEFYTDVTFDVHFVKGVGTYQITGGTGRFENATGSGSFTVAHQEDGTTVITWDGALGT